MTLENQGLFAAFLSAGAILSGFCGTFLSFRIQREANYHRQPVLDFDTESAKDVSIGLSHFSSSFFILIIASIVTAVFGLVIPLLLLSGVIIDEFPIQIISAGLLAGLVLICGYFLVELRHYNIISNRLMHDKAEWGRQRATVATLIAVAVAVYVVVAHLG